MTDESYLRKVLKDQTLSDDSIELKDLEQHRSDVERLLKKKFGSGPKVREGGSKAKGTMIREAYDFDLAYYFAHEDDTGGETIKEIYKNVENALQDEYQTARKGVAVRLLDAEKDTDFHVDVIPGRFIDGHEGDAFLYPSSSDKERLQTNLTKHVEHVRDSGVVDAIRLLKLWKARRHIGVKTFALELLTIAILDGGTTVTLPNQLKRVWTEFRDNMDSLSVTDPANSNNDLSDMLSERVRQELREQARETLKTIDDSGWEAVFGDLGQDAAKAAKIEALRRIATSSPAPAKPWSRGA